MVPGSTPRSAQSADFRSQALTSLVKPISRCVSSQNGVVFDFPQRQSVMSVPSRFVDAAHSGLRR